MDCCICGNGDPFTGTKCNIAPWLRFLSNFHYKIIQPDCPEGKVGRPLLTRWILWTNAKYSLFAHLFHRSDLDEHHDHPWSFITFLMSSGYWEHVPEDFFWDHYLQSYHIPK